MFYVLGLAMLTKFGVILSMFRRRRLCYNLAVRFYSWLRRNSGAMAVAVVLAGIVVAPLWIFAFYDRDRMLEATILAVALFALVLAVSGLIFLRREVAEHVRPVISVGKIESSASISRESTHFTLDTVSIGIHNTGLIPPKRPKVHVCLHYIDSGEIAWQDEMEIAWFSRETRIPLDFSDLSPPEIQQAIYQGKMKLEIRVSYKGIAENYRTKQTYRIFTNGTPLTAPNFTVFLFEPIEPESYC